MTKQELDKLNKKLAEWAGFTCQKVPIPFKGKKDGKEYTVFVNISVWKFPDGTDSFDPVNDGPELGGLPNFPESLDACFKHIRPKLLSTIQVEDICFGQENGVEHCHILWWTGIPKTDTYGCGVYEGRSDNPTTAFCLAAEKVIDSEVK